MTFPYTILTSIVDGGYINLLCSPPNDDNEKKITKIAFNFLFSDLVDRLHNFAPVAKTFLFSFNVQLFLITYEIHGYKWWSARQTEIIAKTY